MYVLELKDESIGCKDTVQEEKLEEGTKILELRVGVPKLRDGGTRAGGWRYWRCGEGGCYGGVYQRGGVTR